MKETSAPIAGVFAAYAGQERVLVVDDNEIVRALAHRALSSCGYTVLAASSAEEALEIIHREGHHIDLGVFDIVMPGMNGYQLALNIHGDGHRMKIIFMSAFPRDILTNQEGVIVPIEYLSKPFDVAQLCQTVRAALDAKAS